ncbi:MAG: UPF0104 family protein [Alphaproteobacteria bacterium]|nr:MAG: UPF0104 family protein [Alphaproteobacteria bacterium]
MRTVTRDHIRGRSRRRLLWALKLAFGLGLLAALVLWRDTGRQLLDLLGAFEARYLVVLAVIALAMRWTSALKWSILLRARGLRLPLARLFALYLIGQFFNNFMPSMIGGDIAKSYLLGRQIGSQARSAASVVADRLSGLVALVVMTFALAALNVELIDSPLVGAAVAGMSALCFAGIIGIACGRSLASWARRHGLGAWADRIARPLARFHGELTEYRHAKGMLALAMACSIIFYFLASLSVYYGCAAIGYWPAYLDVALITPILFLVSSVPVSPNNVGWWEWSLGLLLAGTGAQLADGVMVALIMRAVSTAISLIGGILFLMERIEGHGQPTP